MAGFRLEVPRAALVITDPQVDFLSPRGLAWRLVGESVERNHTVDLAKRLRGAGVSQVVLAGMSANLCVEPHLRALLESGFEVAVVEDATAAAALDEGDGYQAALVNFRYIADALWSTDEALRQI